MADLSINFAGIRAPNPFWLASAPPTNTGAQIHRAFEYGWGGAVWKTIGAPVLNISNRYGGLSIGGQRLLAVQRRGRDRAEEVLHPVRGVADPPQVRAQPVERGPGARGHESDPPAAQADSRSS